MSRFTNQVAIVTGAGSGMGRLHAVELAREGAKVVVHDVNAEGVAETAERIAQTGGQESTQWIGDITDVSAVAGEVDRIAAAHGRIDVLINNAGYVSPGQTQDIDEAAFDRMFAVHVKGTFFTTQAVTRHMNKKRGGVIVNIASTAGLVGHHHFPHYCAAKSAIVGLTKSWAKEFAKDRIRVNAVAPGGVKTPLSIGEFGGEENLEKRATEIPLGFYGGPEDITPLVLFLASDDARYITGQIVSPNGGEIIY